MKRIKKIIIGCILAGIIAVSLPITSFAQDKFSEALDASTDKIKTNLDKSSQYFENSTDRLAGTKLFVYDMTYKFVFPILIVASILVVLIGLYDLMFSGKDEIEKGLKYIIYGVLGIIVIQSAKFITSTYMGIIAKVAPSDTPIGEIGFAQSAYEIYNQLLMPFITLFMYIVIGVLFVLLLMQVFKLITSSEEEIAAKARTIIISNVVGIIVILMSKMMVEAIYGKQADVIKRGADMGDIGSGILAGADFTVVFSIINYFLGFLGLIILIIIIVQTYQLLVNPTNDELIKKTKTNLLYIVIGLAIIAGAYMIINLAIIQ